MEKDVLICEEGDGGSSILGIWHTDNETQCKVTVNVTQIKSGISILILWLP